MARKILYVLALGVAAGCSGSAADSPLNPFDPTPTDSATGGGTGDGAGDGTGDPTTPIDGGLELPPGTANPTPDNSITRYEARDENGSGFAEAPVYNAANDTFSIDNLPFDSDDNIYTRDDQVGSLGPAGQQGPFAVYEGPGTAFDPQTGKTIDQLTYKALFQRSTSGLTELVIVRTGDYRNYGFGGWAYQRDGNVVLPSKLQATFSGPYAALRDFQGRPGLEYATGDFQLDVDFEDLNGTLTQDAIKGKVTNRRIYATDGTDVTQDVINALAADANRPFTALPTMVLDVNGGKIDRNGEFTGTFESGYTDGSGKFVVYHTGTYQGILAGPDPSEAVGTIVTTSQDPRFEDVTVRETGGFIATRD